MADTGADSNSPPLNDADTGADSNSPPLNDAVAPWRRRRGSWWQRAPIQGPELKPPVAEAPPQQEGRRRRGSWWMRKPQQSITLDMSAVAGGGSGRKLTSGKGSESNKAGGASGAVVVPIRRGSSDRGASRGRPKGKLARSKSLSRSRSKSLSRSTSMKALVRSPSLGRYKLPAGASACTSACAGRYIILPTSNVRKTWDLIIMFWLLYCAVVIPLRIAFDLQTGQAFDTVVDVFFWADILLNFMTAIEVDGIVDQNPAHIAVSYCKGWLFLDIVSSFPYGAIIDTVDNPFPTPTSLRRHSATVVLSNFRLLKMIRLIRLFRVLRLTRILARLEITLGLRTATLSIWKFAFFVFLSAHWYACLWYLIAQWDGFENDSWVSQDGTPSITPAEAQRMGLRQSFVAEQYVASLYWSVTTMATIGYGDISPTTTGERVFGLFAMVTATFLFNYGITTVVTLVANTNRAVVEFKSKMDSINEWMTFRRISNRLRLKIRKFVHNRRQALVLLNERKLLENLSVPLRISVLFKIHEEMIEKTMFLTCLKKNKPCLAELLMLMEPIAAPSQEVIFERNERASTMYVITGGRVGIYTSPGVEEDVLVVGDRFGESAIVMGLTVRNYTAIALEWCDMLALQREKVDLLKKQYPLIQQAIRDAAHKSEKIKHRLRRKFSFRHPPPSPTSSDSSTEDRSFGGFEEHGGRGGEVGGEGKSDHLPSLSLNMVDHAEMQQFADDADDQSDANDTDDQEELRREHDRSLPQQDGHESKTGLGSPDSSNSYSASPAGWSPSWSVVTQTPSPVVRRRHLKQQPQQQPPQTLTTDYATDYEDGTIRDPKIHSRSPHLHPRALPSPLARKQQKANARVGGSGRSARGSNMPQNGGSGKQQKRFTFDDFDGAVGAVGGRKRPAQVDVSNARQHGAFQQSPSHVRGAEAAEVTRIDTAEGGAVDVESHQMTAFDPAGQHDRPHSSRIRHDQRRGSDPTGLSWALQGRRSPSDMLEDMLSNDDAAVHASNTPHSVGSIVSVDSANVGSRHQRSRSRAMSWSSGSPSTAGSSMSANRMLSRRRFSPGKVSPPFLSGMMVGGSIGGGVGGTGSVRSTRSVRSPGSGASSVPSDDQQPRAGSITPKLVNAHSPLVPRTLVRSISTEAVPNSSNIGNRHRSSSLDSAIPVVGARPNQQDSPEHHRSNSLERMRHQQLSPVVTNRTVDGYLSGAAEILNDDDGVFNDGGGGDGDGGDAEGRGRGESGASMRVVLKRVPKAAPPATKKLKRQSTPAVQLTAVKKSSILSRRRNSAPNIFGLALDVVPPNSPASANGQPLASFIEGSTMDAAAGASASDEEDGSESGDDSDSVLSEEDSATGTLGGSRTRPDSGIITTFDSSMGTIVPDSRGRHGASEAAGADAIDIHFDDDRGDGEHSLVEDLWGLRELQQQRGLHAALQSDMCELLQYNAELRIQNAHLQKHLMQLEAQRLTIQASS